MHTNIPNTNNIIITDVFTISELKELIDKCNYEPIYDEAASPELIQLAAFTSDSINPSDAAITSSGKQMIGFISCIVPEFLYSSDNASDDDFDNVPNNASDDDFDNVTNNASVDAFDIEITAMISPYYRNMGLFTRLFASLKKTINKQCSNAGIFPPAITYLVSKECIQPVKDTKAPQMDYAYSDYLMTLSVNEAASYLHKYDRQLNKTAYACDNKHYAIVNDNEEFLLIDTTSDLVISSAAFSVYEKCICIYDVWTNPDYRKKGYARYLLAHTINNFINDKSLSIDSFMLHVSSRNVAAVRLYNSMGFTTSQEIKQYKLL